MSDDIDRGVVEGGVLEPEGTGAAGRMTDGERALCVAYAVIAVVALVATWWNNIDYFSSSDSDGMVGFVEDAFDNPAAASLGWDLLFVALAAQILMIVEGVRLKVRFLWAYVVAGFAVAISVAFPLFLIARQRRLRAGAGV